MTGPIRDPLEAQEGRPRRSGIRLVWVMLLRVGLISALLGATLVLNHGTSEPFGSPSPRFLLALIAFTYVATILYSVWYRVGRGIAVLAHCQFTVDLITWGCLAYATGGIASAFTFLFDLWVIVAAVALGSRAAFTFAGASAAILTALAALMSTGAMAPLPDQFATVTSVTETLYFLGVNAASLFLVAALVSSLVARIERTGRGLERERAQRMDLTVLHADIIRSIGVGLATTGIDGEILAINPAGREILGIGDSDAQGVPLRDWIPAVAELLSGDELPSARGHATGSRGDGVAVPLEYTVTPLLSAEGERRGAIVIFNDLTEVRHLEAALERARRLAALGELAASLAHEIRNPLGAVSGSIQMIARRPGVDPEERALSDIILREIERMERLVGDILDYARPREPSREEIDTGEVVGEVVRAFLAGQDSEGRRVSFESEPGLKVVADASQIKQVIWNLLRNAAQATDEGDGIAVGVAKSGERVVVEVEDTGAGIRLEDTERIFDPFYSTRERGIGLGLALCKRIVEAHEGGVEAFPGEESGLVVRVALPAAGRGRLLDS